MFWIIDFVSARYLEYTRRYDYASILWITFFISLWLLLLAVINTSFDIFIIPEWLITIWLYAILIPIFISILGIILLFLHWFLFLILKVVHVKYEDTIFAYYGEKFLWIVFPKKLFVSKMLSFSPRWEHSSRAIYYGVLLNMLFAIVVLFYITFSYSSQSASMVNDGKFTPLVMQILWRVNWILRF